LNKNKVFSSLVWRFAERTGAQLVAFVVSVVLARILSPKDYGTVALITVFTTLLQVFVDSGLGNALIQKKNADNIDFSTVFFTNIVFCLVLYTGIFFASPYIADFYGDAAITDYMRVLALTVVISGVKNVQQAYVSRKMLFKRFFFSTLGGTIVAGIAGVAMAMVGFGVWALVAQQVINLAIDTLILWVTVKWRPEFKFSFNRLKGLFSFGWKLLVSTMIDKVYTEIRQLIIGKMYSSSSLAFYNRGRQLPFIIINNINVSIDSVLLPSMSREQDDKSKVKAMTRRSIQISTYIMAPLMVGLAFMAEPVVSLILTDKWLPCVPFLRIFCITFLFYPIHTANLNAIKAMGRSDLFLILEIIKKAVGLAALIATMWFGVMAMAYSLLFTSVASQIINSWPNRKLLNYSYIEQLKDIIPNILLACFMGLCVYFIEFIGLPVILTLAIQMILAAAIYIGGSIFLKVESYSYVKDIIRGYLKKRKKNESKQ
jgi:O-antigen/teichoic acid export membrane protein